MDAKGRTHALNPDSSWLPSPLAHALPLPPRPPPLGLVPDSESHAKCVNQRAGKYRLLAERAWEGNVTPAVALEQKKQAVASPLSTPSLLSNKDGVRLNRRSGRQKATFESRPWGRNMAGTYRGCQIPLGPELFMHKQCVCVCSLLCVSSSYLFDLSHFYLYLVICYCSDVDLNLYKIYTHTNLFHDAFICSTHIQDHTWMVHTHTL